VPPSEYADELAALLAPAAVLTRKEVLTALPGACTLRRYGWYFDQVPPPSRLINAEIGDRLFLCPRTVASHLYRSYSKLGIAGRHQLRDLTEPTP